MKTHVPRVVADVDTGIDDALALSYLALLHRQGRIDLRVTTSAGNCTADNAAANSADVLAAMGVDIPVTAGAPAPLQVPLTTTPVTHGPTGLGYHTTQASASDYPTDVAAAVATWEGADYILVAGPATNLAWAMENAPQVLTGARICLMSGAFIYPGNTTPTAEWNAWVDPHALKSVLAGLGKVGAEPPVFCPLNVTEQVLLSPERLDAWNLPDKLGTTLLNEAMRFYFEFHQQVGVGYTAQIHDLAAAMVLLDTVDYTAVSATVDVEAESELMRGTTVADYANAAAQGDGREDGCEVGVGPYWGHKANARIVKELLPDDVFAEFERALNQENRKERLS